jgi:hypothetical protein
MTDMRLDSSDRATATGALRQTPPPASRVRLNPALPGPGVVDGAWWPHTLNLEAELPELIAGLDSRLGVITRVMLNVDAWAECPRRLAAGNRRIHVGRFQTMDPSTIGLTNTDRERFVLLVVPPAATTTSAEIAMAMAADADNSTRPTDILAASELAG